MPSVHGLTASGFRRSYRRRWGIIESGRRARGRSPIDRPIDRCRGHRGVGADRPGIGVVVPWPAGRGHRGCDRGPQPGSNDGPWNAGADRAERPRSWATSARRHRGGRRDWAGGAQGQRAGWGRHGCARMRSISWPSRPSAKGDPTRLSGLLATGLEIRRDLGHVSGSRPWRRSSPTSRSPMTRTIGPRSSSAAQTRSGPRSRGRIPNRCSSSMIACGRRHARDLARRGMSLRTTPGLRSRSPKSSR